MLGVWEVANVRTGLEVEVPAVALFECYRFLLVAALIPQAAATEWGLAPRVAALFLAALHRSLAEAVAERMRRRGQLLAELDSRVPVPGALGEEAQPTRVMGSGGPAIGGRCAGVGAAARPWCATHRAFTAGGGASFSPGLGGLASAVAQATIG